MKAMIFAAGLGTRLRPLTDSMPKALVPVCGKPLLWHVMMKLKEAGIDEVVVNVHHFAGMIEDYLESVDCLGMTVHVSDERDMLRETGGGIMHARKFLEATPGGFLVHNVDIISDLDLRGFVSQCRPDALATLLVSERKTSRYLLFDSQMRLVGWTNISTGEVRTPYPDLDVAACRRLAFSGIHYMSTGIFSAMEDVLGNGTGAFPECFPIMDFYLKTAAEYPVYGVEAKDLHLVDVGKLQSLDEAERLCASLLKQDL